MNIYPSIGRKAVIAPDSIKIALYGRPPETGLFSVSESEVYSRISTWLPGVHDLRITTSTDSIGYAQESPQKSDSNRLLEPEKTDAVNKPQHIIHKTVAWEKMLDDGEVGSLSEIAKKEGLTRARVTQIMNLLKLPSEWREFLLRLDNPKEIRKYSERRLRNYQLGGDAPPPIGKKSCPGLRAEIPEKSRGKQKQPPKIIVVEIDEPLPYPNLEAQKELIKKAALRKLKKLEDNNS